MKVALCFIISNDHILNKEDIWKRWINENKSLFNVYFHYKNYNLISSEWIRNHCIPPNKIAKTSYYHVVPAYMSILNFAFQNTENKWFCLLTESCVPIINPNKFRQIMQKHIHQTIMSWKPAYWNIDYHTRANLKLLKSDFHLSHAPWFIISRDHVNKLLYFLVKENKLYKTICEGGLANESLFAIVLQSYNELNNNDKVINEVSTLTDWTRMETATSPYLFKYGDENEIKEIKKLLKKNNYGIFLRKVSKDFPDDIISNLIFNNEIKKLNQKDWFIGCISFTLILLTTFSIGLLALPALTAL